MPEKLMKSLLSLITAVSLLIPAYAETAAAEMYRLYNPNTGEHFFTANAKEKDALLSYGWSDEGIGWYAPASSSTPVYRLYSSLGEDHHYTMNAGERDALIKEGWTDEGIGWYSDDAKTVPLYRAYNPNADSCNHNYTTNKNEQDYLISCGWTDEGIGWYGLKEGKPAEPKPDQFAALEKTIREKTKKYGGDWVIFVEDMKTSQTLVYNSHPMVSASLIKLFVAGAYFDAAEKGKISRTKQSEALLQSMIRVSSNDAWKKLETHIGKGSYQTGYKAVTAFANAFGCADTGRQTTLNGTRKKANYTSAASMGKVLDAIYRGEYVSRTCSASILLHMKNQQRRTKIPAGLPKGIVCANKTGELDSCQHDAAIVYGTKTDYIVVIMTDGVKGSHVIRDINEMSSLIYKYLNP